MQSPYLPFTPFLGFPDLHLSSLSTSPISTTKFPSRVSCNTFNGRGKRSPNQKTRQFKITEKNENIWSVDNELAKSEAMTEKGSKNRRRKRGGKRVKNSTKRDKNSRVLVSSTMLMEVETVLQTQEPVIRPIWNTFASSVSGIWKGVGAVFSPITAEMEPIDIGRRNENLYDCYTLDHVQAVESPDGGNGSQIRRKINWVTLNPHGEMLPSTGGSLSTDEAVGGKMRSQELPKFETFDVWSSDVLEEDAMGMEPGLVFFEDGSYSRGPMDIPVGDVDESKYFLSPTLKFEQCLVKGCHKRLRIVHTIEFSNGGSEIQIMRVAVYEEQWMSPASLPDPSDMDLDVKPFSQRKRIQPSELTGSWKVFEMSATPIYSDETMNKESAGLPYVYLCTETLKKRSFPESSVYFGEEEMLDMQDVAVLWLPGGVTGYVDVNKDGILCIGVGWYSVEGINLVMERDYGMDGKLKEVRWKSEVKRRWSEPLPE